MNKCCGSCCSSEFSRTSFGQFVYTNLSPYDSYSSYLIRSTNGTLFCVFRHRDDATSGRKIRQIQYRSAGITGNWKARYPAESCIKVINPYPASVPAISVTVMFGIRTDHTFLRVRNTPTIAPIKIMGATLANSHSNA